MGSCKYVYLLFCVFASASSVAQNEIKKWYFGNMAGLDFMTSPPAVLINSSMNQLEGCASMADAVGNLLFYTDGQTVWDRAHLVMANGTGLLGNFSSAQAALIVKQPGNATIYYIFTSDYSSGTGGIYYNTIDISLAAGMGSVTVKNTLLAPLSTERLTAALHCNGADVWVITHDRNSDKFRANLVTSSGVITSPTISAVGPNINTNSSYQGCIKVSPTGRKLLMSAVASTPLTSLSLYDFNTATGVISNPLNLFVGFPMYGCEFSPDERKVYGGVGHAGKIIYQWDLCAGSATAIVASQYSIATGITTGMQLAPDGKIYVGQAYKPYLGVINNPNVGGSACNYVDQGQGLTPKMSTYGLPNIMSHHLKGPLQPFTYSTSASAGCLDLSFYPPGCPMAGFPGASVLWEFGDLSSGAANTSTLSSPTHTYSSAGIYTVKLTIYNANACGSVTDVLSQPVTVTTSPTPLSAGSFTICSGQTLTVTASGNITYTWSTGATTSSIGVMPSGSTVYTVSGITPGGCVNSATAAVTVYSVPVVAVSGAGTVCAGETFTLGASGATSYSWNTGAFTSTIAETATGTTIYTVTGAVFNGCTHSDTLAVTVYTLPTLSLSGTDTVCPGSSLLIGVSGATGYTWSTGAQSNTVLVSPTVTSSYTVSARSALGCISSAITTVSVYPAPSLTIAGDASVCQGQALALAVSGGTSFLWSNGASGNLLNLSPAVPGVYIVSGSSAAGCTGTTAITVTVNTLPTVMVAGSSTACPGMPAIKIVSGASGYTWNTGATSSTVSLSPAATTTYTVHGMDSNGCSDTMTTVVTVDIKPAVTGFFYSNSICTGQTGVLTPVHAAGFNQGGAYFAPGLEINPLNGAVNVKQPGAGVYPVSYSLAPAGCVAAGMSTAQIVVLPSPDLAVSADMLIKPGSSATLSASGGENYTWQPAIHLSCSDCATPVASPSESTRYCVTSAINACESRVCVEVVVSCETGNDYSVPNAFSPNGDGVNDVFCLQGWSGCLLSFRVVIFDRWGEKVFESGDPDFCWDGIYKGKILDMDAFVYVIAWQKKHDQPVAQKKGTISLIR